MLMLPQLSFASYNVTHLNTTLVLNSTGAAQVKEILTVGVSGNDSIKQYSTARLSLNFTISQWQDLVGPELAEHIVNPRTGVSDFNLLPGPIVNLSLYKHIAYITMSYEVNNVTAVNQTGPRIFRYTFNDNVFNFEHAASGLVLFPNATLNVVLPPNSKVISIYPLPDLPVSGIAQDYQNTTQFSWNQGEPLSQFTLTFTSQEGLQDEVLGFFSSVYQSLGALVYVIIVAVAVAFVAYTYYRAKK
jgi:hypothetical protein